jgi:hypothetical protein
LCPRQDVCESFYQAEDPRGWHDWGNAWFIEEDWLESSGVPGGDSETDFYDYFLYGLEYWRKLLPVMLYSADFLSIPVILQIEPRFSVFKLRMQWPIIAWPQSVAKADKEGPQDMDQFMAKLNDRLPEQLWPPHGQTLWKSALVTAERYVRGRLLSDPHEDGDHFERALFQYLIGLESLLMNKGEGGEITEKLATRSAWLAAQDEEERKVASSIVKWMYQLRSRVAHEGILPSYNVADLQRLAEVARRVIAATISLGNDPPGSFEDLVKNATISREAQDRICEAVKTVCQLTDAPRLTAPERNPSRTPQ